MKSPTTAGQCRGPRSFVLLCGDASPVPHERSPLASHFQQHRTHKCGSTKRGHVGVPAVSRWPTHVDDEHINTVGAQPVNDFSRKRMPVNVAPNDEYRLVRLKAWQRRSLGRYQAHRLRRKGRMRAEPVEAPRTSSGPSERPPCVVPTAILGSASSRTTRYLPAALPASPLLQVGHQRFESAPPHPWTSFARKRRPPAARRAASRS